MSHWAPPWAVGPGDLVIFDFDNTLFRSPGKPLEWTEGWWGNVKSLGPPFVPETPGPEWWHADIVAAARRAIDSGAQTALFTGRITRRFKGRVEDLLRQAGLTFGLVELAPNRGSQTTLEWKTKRFGELVAAVQPRSLTIYEDRIEHVEAFRAAFQGLKIPVRIVHVT